MVFFSPSFSLLENILFSFFLLYFSIFPNFFFFFPHYYFIIFVFNSVAILLGGFSFGLFLLSSAECFVLHSFRLSLLICSPCVVWVCFIQSFRLSFFAVFSLFGWVFLIFTRLFVFLYSSSGLGEYCSTKRPPASVSTYSIGFFSL